MTARRSSADSSWVTFSFSRRSSRWRASATSIAPCRSSRRPRVHVARDPHVRGLRDRRRALHLAHRHQHGAGRELDRLGDQRQPVGVVAVEDHEREVRVLARDQLDRLRHRHRERRRPRARAPRARRRARAAPPRARWRAAPASSSRRRHWSFPALLYTSTAPPAQTPAGRAPRPCTPARSPSDEHELGLEHLEHPRLGASASRAYPAEGGEPRSADAGRPRAAGTRPPGRPAGARAARAALPAAGAPARAPLPARRRGARRPDPGRLARPAEGDRPVRPGAHDGVLELRRADDPGRAQAPLPRQGLVGARAARPAGAGGASSSRPPRRSRARSAASRRPPSWPSASA